MEFYFPSNIGPILFYVCYLKDLRNYKSIHCFPLLWLPRPMRPVLHSISSLMVLDVVESIFLINRHDTRKIDIIDVYYNECFM